MKAFLTKDPLFASRFSKVWLWSEWPSRAGRHDTGIDLVAEEADRGLCAIQCKFYGEGQYIAKADIDSFLAASGERYFTSRLIISTTERWSANAEKELANQLVPVERIGIAELETSPFDWSRFDPEHPDQLIRKAPKAVRPHQENAIDDVVSGFESSNRGKLIMACGTGKTFTALKIAEKVTPPGGLVAFCVPSISLLSQSLRAWSTDSTRPIEAIAVCSDAQVTKDSEDAHIYDLALPATTDPARIAEHVSLARKRASSIADPTDKLTRLDNPMVVVFTTYQSLDRVKEAQSTYGLPAFDLLIADEAHRTTGAFESDKSFSGFTLVHDESLLCVSRLYMTATPRIYTEKVRSRAAEAKIEVCSMDDELLYGPEFHYLGFGKSVEQGLLSDYRVIVLMVDEAEANKSAHDVLVDEDLELSLPDAAKLIGCWQGLSKRGSKPDEFSHDPAPMRRVVSFATTIKNSKQIQRALPEVVRSASNNDFEGVDCETRHVDGTMVFAVFQASPRNSIASASRAFTLCFRAVEM
ncbi:MAG: restriction endonuclease [Acidimicrobiales bacterium]